VRRGAQIGRIVVQSQLQQKVGKTSISTGHSGLSPSLGCQWETVLNLYEAEPTEKSLGQLGLCPQQGSWDLSLWLPVLRCQLFLLMLLLLALGPSP
jgi:hypothetical protein